MVRVLIDQAYIEGKSYKELACLSTDTKPTDGIITGSLALEVDTGDVYAYDEEGDTGSEWVKICELGGSGEEVQSALSATPSLSLNRPVNLAVNNPQAVEEPEEEETPEGDGE